MIRTLTLCLLGNFSCFLSSADFFIVNFLEKFFQGPEQNVGPDLGPNCLQRLSADDTCRQEIIS